MKQISTIGWTLTLLAAAGLCFPATTFAATDAKQRVTDVKLLNGGILVGQVIDAQGKATAGKPLVVHYQNKLVASPTTDKNGYFALKGVEPGIYRIASMKGVADYRAWAKGTAPPKAAAGALLIEGTKTIRGQDDGMIPDCPPPPQTLVVREMMCNPLVIGAIVATAIAVPVAIHNSQNNRTPVSP